ncbi:MAG: UDP-glucose--hexose-1-phosphate uridylyltransferase [Clostridia bacterium]|nr:UDP-glucose--hexose-1-phosphate uridylyltransferase [Clostridia bacterium]
MIDSAVKKLISYGLETGLLPPEEAVYARNLLLDALNLDAYTDDGRAYQNVNLEETLGELLDYACESGIIEDTVTDRDLFDTRLMNALTARPRTVIDTFREKYAESPQAATDWYYKFSQDSDYIRRYRIARDRRWQTPTEYGDLDITINLSKPEKDPKAIAAARSAAASSYPKCQLCVENEGYAGRADHPARETLRIIPIEVAGQPWGLQYSPYTYYNEHCIALNSEHTPMKIDHDTFVKLFDITDQLPHYFVGSNADLPIVGGSILSHDHFQGGRYEFAMAKAPIERQISMPGFDGVEAGTVRWPMSVIRLRGSDREQVTAAADHILDAWRSYSDPSVSIYAETDGEPHNTITPIARRRGSDYELDLVLRNNLTTLERPDGLFHPPAELHHIKKENIGLIEVMGLAVLPARLKKELDAVARALTDGTDLSADPLTEKHAVWAEEVKKRHPELNAGNVEAILRDEVGLVFQRVLEAAGVFKRDAAGKQAFTRFTDSLGVR